MSGAEQYNGGMYGDRWLSSMGPPAGAPPGRGGMGGGGRRQPLSVIHSEASAERRARLESSGGGGIDVTGQVKSMTAMMEGADPTETLLEGGGRRVVLVDVFCCA